MHSSDLKLNPHIHAVFLDGAYRDKGDTLEFLADAHLSTRDVAAVLERTRDRMARHLRRRGLLEQSEDADAAADNGLANLAAAPVPARPPYDPWKSPTGDWRSRVLRRANLGDHAAE